MQAPQSRGQRPHFARSCKSACVVAAKGSPTTRNATSAVSASSRIASTPWSRGCVRRGKAEARAKRDAALRALRCASRARHGGSVRRARLLHALAVRQLDALLVQRLLRGAGGARGRRSEPATARQLRRERARKRWLGREIRTRRTRHSEALRRVTRRGAAAGRNRGVERGGNAAWHAPASLYQRPEWRCTPPNRPVRCGRERHATYRGGVRAQEGGL